MARCRGADLGRERQAGVDVLREGLLGGVAKAAAGTSKVGLGRGSEGNGSAAGGDVEGEIGDAGVAVEADLRFGGTADGGERNNAGRRSDVAAAQDVLGDLGAGSGLFKGVITERAVAKAGGIDDGSLSWGVIHQGV